MLSFFTAIERCLISRYFNFHNRASRSEFWWFMLFSFIANQFISLFLFIDAYGLLIYGICCLYLFIANLSVSIRRLHDHNVSGLILLLFYIPFLYLIVAVFLFILQLEQSLILTEFQENLYIISCLLAFVIFIASSIYLFIMYITRGSVGANKYGQDPIFLEELKHYQN